jgi:NAD dependent epimerase/dehydratase family enzyme
MSWIHLSDWLAIVNSLIERPELSGAFNATAPNPVSNQSFSQQLAKQLHRPALLPMPSFVLKLLLGEMSELILGSQRVLPEHLLAAGFKFQYPELAPALQQILNSD